MSAERELELAAPPSRVAAQLAELAEQWGGEWEEEADGGRLALPVVYGLRRGVECGRLELGRLGAGGTRLRWRPESSDLEVQRSSVAVLSLAAVPLLVTIAWPFWPALFPLVPFAAIFGLIAWWLVVARLRTRGVEEFLRELAAATPADAPPPVGLPGSDVDSA